MRFAVWLSLMLWGCGSVPVEETGAVAPPVDTSIDWPLWVYQFDVAAKTSTFDSGGQPLVRVEGYAWASSFGGPTLVAEPDQEIAYTITNGTSMELPFTFEGVEVITPVVVPAGDGAQALLRSTQGPGVHVYRVPSTGDELARAGLFGLITVRDPAEFAVDEIEQQANIIVVDLPLAATEVDGCVSGTVTDPASCPAWTPATAAYGTVVISQKLLVNPLQRHGGPPNEFSTTTIRELVWNAGEDVRINFGSLGAETHTLALGGLSWTDPTTGGSRDAVVVEPGIGAHLMLYGVGPAGTYEVSCLDHDHHGLDRVVIRIEE